MTAEDFVARALRVPFLAHGRDYAGWDCWGVVLCAYRDVLGVELPSYDDDYDAPTGTDPRLAKLVMSEALTWRRLGDGEPSQPLDVAVFNIYGRPLHVALVLDARRMLHTEDKIGTIVEPLATPMWAKRREGIYRHE